MASHLLSLIIFSPLVGVAIILLLPKAQESLYKWISLANMALVSALTFAAFLQFDPNQTGFQLVEKTLWIPQLNVYYLLGTDGISFPMVVLTALISTLASIGSFSIKKREKEYYCLYLFLVTGMMGTFLALDMILFYVFWEVVLVPMYFLIGIWGGPRKEYAAMKFFLYTFAGSLLMLVGILGMYFNSAPHTFNIMELVAQDFSFGFQKIVFLALFVGFAVKVPTFPFHTWLPDAHVEAPTPISVILAGVLLKMGTYGFFRFSFPILPEAANWFRPYLAILAAIGIVYGGFIALAQTDFKKMVAYSSISHMGFVLLGLAAFSTNGFNGAMLQMFSHGVITGALFLLVGVIYDRAHTRDMNAFGGLNAQLPVYSGFLVFFSLASLGLPGLSGFVSEFLVLLGSYEYSKLYTAFACMGILLAACYLLFMVRRVLLGPANPKWESLPDINMREVVTIIPLLIITLGIGIYPRYILSFFIPTLQDLLASIGGTLM
ncbi:NADH-quinone oxidoreductase subunit M [Acaryochloris sp. IP29b_bin.148]|uniref:complex I subunit 4 family protein n=1 Tax=Acaryochloris sp. IP29b_bin.148 TaxID=2969218 RepID=UPI002615C7B5|nr:NADH-quinone oxidoreductase subunit M [Acaryochloris sp. IP29b_bin.148]